MSGSDLPQGQNGQKSDVVFNASESFSAPLSRPERETPRRSSAKAEFGQTDVVSNRQETPSRDSREHRMCLGKIRYPSKRDALTAINSFSRKRGRHGRPESLRAYCCPICNGWHLTKKTVPHKHHNWKSYKPFKRRNKYWRN